MPSKEAQPTTTHTSPKGYKKSGHDTNFNNSERSFQSEWANVCPRPLVLFLDEIDALTKSFLESVLKELRTRFSYRLRNFPHSIVLCGLGDVRDYKIASGGSQRLATASPFNIKVKSIKIGSFEFHEVAALYLQHTAETGQKFEVEALAKAFELTGGQPWLVNALPREVVEGINLKELQNHIIARVV